MVIFFLVMGTLSAGMTAKANETGFNITLAIIAVGCYACAVALKISGIN